MLFLARFVQVDKIDAQNFGFYLLWFYFQYFCCVKLKRKQALLGSNLTGIYLTDKRMCLKKGLSLDSPFNIFGIIYASKNPSINFILRSFDNPL